MPYLSAGYVVALVAGLAAFPSVRAAPPGSEQRCPPDKCTLTVKVVPTAGGCAVSVDIETFHVVGKRAVTWQLASDDPSATYAFAGPGIKWIKGPEDKSDKDADESAREHFEPFDYGATRIRREGRGRHSGDHHHGRFHYYQPVVVRADGRSCDVSDPRIAND